MAETPNRSQEFTQARARRTYEALIASATALFAKNGYDNTGSPDIAAGAGVAVGTFYRYFDDKKQIYLEVMERHLTAAQKEILTGLTPEALVPSTRRAAIAHAIELLVSHVERHAAVYHLLLEMSLRDADVLALRKRFDQETRDQLARLIATVAGPSAFTDPATAAFTIQNLVVEIASAMIVRKDVPQQGRDHCVEALTTLVHRALFNS